MHFIVVFKPGLSVHFGGGEVKKSFQIVQLRILWGYSNRTEQWSMSSQMEGEKNKNPGPRHQEIKETTDANRFKEIFRKVEGKGFVMDHFTPFEVVVFTMKIEHHEHSAQKDLKLFPRKNHKRQTWTVLTEITYMRSQRELYTSGSIPLRLFCLMFSGCHWQNIEKLPQVRQELSY